MADDIKVKYTAYDGLDVAINPDLVSEDPGIHITNIVQPEHGAIILYYCKECKRTEIFINEHAVKPKDGDAWKISFPCPKHYSYPKDNFYTESLPFSVKCFDLGLCITGI